MKFNIQTKHNLLTLKWTCISNASVSLFSPANKYANRTIRIMFQTVALCRFALNMMNDVNMLSSMMSFPLISHSGIKWISILQINDV